MGAPADMRSSGWGVAPLGCAGVSPTLKEVGARAHEADLKQHILLFGGEPCPLWWIEGEQVAK